MSNYCTLYIVRHAESVANFTNILGGDYPLTKLGEAQASLLHDKLLKIPFAGIYSSDLVRSKRTAELLNIERNLTITSTEVLRERDFGKLDGKLTSEIQSELDSWSETISQMNKDERFNFHDRNGIESDASLIGRYFTFLREVSLANIGKNVLIVSHSNVMRTLLVHLGYATSLQLPRGSIENTGYMKLRSDGIEFFVEETVGINKVV